jgi:hypothetical protein
MLRGKVIWGLKKSYERTTNQAILAVVNDGGATFFGAYRETLISIATLEILPISASLII